MGVLNTFIGTFNLDFPRPAYVGDIENARVILLNGNGGYKPEITPLEFPNKGAEQRAISRLHDPSPINEEVSSYYYDGSYSSWLKSGELAMVNAVAYRAPKITDDVARAAKKLPSTEVHIQWLRKEVMPKAASGLRLIVAHRNRLWGLHRSESPAGVHFTTNGVSEHLSLATRKVIDTFLSR